jgi:hypothetical protein
MGRGTKLGKIEKLLLKEYKWECQGPKPGKKKGRSGILEIFGKYLSIISGKAVNNGVSKIKCVILSSFSDENRKAPIRL